MISRIPVVDAEVELAPGPSQQSRLKEGETVEKTPAFTEYVLQKLCENFKPTPGR